MCEVLMLHAWYRKVDVNAVEQRARRSPSGHDRILRLLPIVSMSSTCFVCMLCETWCNSR
jgi:hypothetical protein